jgi:hypothetical protein
MAPMAHAESVDDRFTHISPKYSPGGGEFVHGQGYGKLLMRVMIFGATPQQGIHYFPEGTDLLFAILYSGGYSDQTRLNGITLRRQGVPELMEVNLEDLIEDGMGVPKLADGDIINVPYSWRRDYQQFTLLSQVFTGLSTLLLAFVAIRR